MDPSSRRAPGALPRALSVVIVGAGIGGLTTAAFLGRSGRHEVQVQVQVQASELAEIGAASPCGRMPCACWRRQVLVRGCGLLGIHRAQLQRMLYDAVPRDVVRLGATCAGFDQDSGGVTVRLDGGGDVRADLLIGADGIGSSVRGHLLGERPPR